MSGASEPPPSDLFVWSARASSQAWWSLRERGKYPSFLEARLVTMVKAGHKCKPDARSGEIDSTP